MRHLEMNGDITLSCDDTQILGESDLWPEKRRYSMPSNVNFTYASLLAATFYEVIPFL